MKTQTPATKATKPGRWRGVFRAVRRGHEREDGQAAFEFLLTIPFLFVFFLLLVDMGLMMYTHVSVSNAVREGARYGAVNCGTGTCSAAEIQQRTVDRSGGMIDNLGDITVAWIDNPGTGAGNATRGDSVVVSVETPYNFLFFPASIQVRSCADMRLEQADQATSLPGGSACAD